MANCKYSFLFPFDFHSLPFFAFQLSLVAALIIFVVLPLIFRYSYTIQRSLLFLPFGESTEYILNNSLL